MNFTQENLQRYLSHKLNSPVEVKKVERFSRGVSRQTWFVTIQRGDSDNEEDLIFRTDLEGGSVEPAPLDQEYFLYERLGHTDIPVAPVLWWEDDPKWTDQPFYIRRKVEGTWNIPNFLDPDPKYDELRIEASKEHMRKLALVHSTDWRSLDFKKYLAIPPDEEACGRVYVQTALRQFEQVRGQGLPVVLEAAEWLMDTAPVAPCISLCKGTNGFGEEVWRDHEIVALSDWEEASIGDPAADFAFMQYMTPELERDGKKIWGLEQALEYYRSVSGIQVTTGNIDYYRVIRAFRLIVMAENCGQALHRFPEVADIRQGWTGTEVGHVCQRGMLAAMGLTEPPTAKQLAEFHESVEATL